MRRPLAIAGFTLLFTNLLCMVLGISASRILGGISLVLLALLWIVKAKNNSRLLSALGGCCFFCLVGCCTFALAFQIQVQPLKSLENTTRSITFRVLEETAVYGDRTYYTVSAKGLYPAEEKPCNIRLSAAAPSTLVPGDEAVAMVTFSLTHSGTLFSENIPLTAVVNKDTSPTKTGEFDGFYPLAHTLRSAIGRSFEQFGSSDTLSLIQGICLGNAGNMSKELQQDFYSCGLGHLVAVSGLHTSQIAGVIIGLFWLVMKRKRWVKLCSLGFVWAFVLLTGASFSALRAAVMFTCFALAQCFFRKPDSLNTLGLAITLILLCNPFGVGSVGFLASVSACVGLIVLASPMEQKLLSLFPQKWTAWKPFAYVIQAFAVTLSAMVATIPCNFLGFCNLSLVAPLANLICVPLATVILILGFLGALLCPVPLFSLAGDLFLWIAHGIASFMMKTAQLLGKIPFHNLVQGTPAAFLVFCLCVLIAVWLFTKGKGIKRGMKMGIVLLLCLATLTSCLLPGVPSHAVEICFIEGEYDSGLVVTSGRDTLYIGCGQTRELDSYLHSRGTNTLDLWILPRRGGYTDELRSVTTGFSPQQIAAPLTKHPTWAYSSRQSPPPMTADTTLQVGEITVTALNDYRSFLITTPYGTVAFEDTEPIAQNPAHFTFTNRKAISNGTAHRLTVQETGYFLTAATVLRLNQKGYTLYQPEFVF